MKAKKEKLYPFSAHKHAHSIEFRRNRVFNEMRDMESGETAWDCKKYDAMCELHDQLTDLLQAVLYSGDGRVAWLTGKQIGLAKETVLWASSARAASLIEAGKTQYLQYC